MPLLQASMTFKGRGGPSRRSVDARQKPKQPLPAQRIETVGGEGAGRDGDPRQHADIEQALRFWARLLNVTRFLEKSGFRQTGPQGSRAALSPRLSCHPISY